MYDSSFFRPSYYISEIIFEVRIFYVLINIININSEIFLNIKIECHLITIKFGIVDSVTKDFLVVAERY